MQHTITQLLSESSDFDEEKFKKYFTKLATKLRALEEYKYLPPKFSYAFETLLEFYDVALKEITHSDSKQRLIKTSYNKRMSRKSISRSSSSGSSMNSSMMGYYGSRNKRAKQHNRSTYSNNSNKSSKSKVSKSGNRNYTTTRKGTKSGTGVRLRNTAKGKYLIIMFYLGHRGHSKSHGGSTISSMNSSIDRTQRVINEISDTDSDEALERRHRRERVKTEEKKTRKYKFQDGQFNRGAKINDAYGNPKITMIQTTQNFNTITNNTNIIDTSGFPDLKTEKVANRLIKRKKNASEIGYLNFPSRSTQKIRQMQEESNNYNNSRDLITMQKEVLQKAGITGGALTQFKKRKQRRLIKQLMEENENNYGSQ